MAQHPRGPDADSARTFAELAAANYGVALEALLVADDDRDNILTDRQLEEARLATEIMRDPPPAEGWSRIGRNGHRSVSIPPEVTPSALRAAAKAAADTSSIVYAEGRHGTPGLSGAIAPEDAPSLRALLSTYPFIVSDSLYAPPRQSLSVLSDAAAAAVALAGSDPVAEPLLGRPDSKDGPLLVAREAAARALVQAASQWPETIRVACILATPPDTDSRYRPSQIITFEPLSDPFTRKEVEALRRAYGLSFREAPRGAVRASIRLPYLAASGWLRRLQVRAYFDLDSGLWILSEITSHSESRHPDDPWFQGQAPVGAQAPTTPDDPKGYSIRLADVCPAYPIVAGRGIVKP